MTYERTRELIEQAVNQIEANDQKYALMNLAVAVSALSEAIQDDFLRLQQKVDDIESNQLSQ